MLFGVPHPTHVTLLWRIVTMPRFPFPRSLKQKSLSKSFYFKLDFMVLKYLTYFGIRCCCVLDDWVEPFASHASRSFRGFGGNLPWRSRYFFGHRVSDIGCFGWRSHGYWLAGDGRGWGNSLVGVERGLVGIHFVEFVLRDGCYSFIFFELQLETQHISM